jgi:hypothetical protein
MLITGLIITALLGLAITLGISRQLKWTEVLGLVFPTGIGAQTFLMVCLDFVGIPLTATTVITVSLLLTATLGVYLFFRRDTLKEWVFRKKTFPKVNWLWIILLIALAVVCVINIAKTMYYPTFDTDSVRGFNLIGMAVAHEGTIKNLSLYTGANFQPMTHNLYMTYTPLAQLGYAYIYMLGAETSKIFNALIFISFLFSFYGVTSRFVTQASAALATLLMIITPEMLGFSSMSGTNFTHAVYASLGLLYFIVWYYKKIPSMLWLSAALLMLNIWTRNEGLAFTGAACCLLCRTSIMTKQYKKLLLFGALCLFPFVFWQIFLKVNRLEIAQLIIFKPYWDGEKASTICREMWALLKSPTFYGYTFTAFVLILLSNVWHIVKKSDQAVTLLLIFLTWAFYTVLVYQIDYVWDSLENVMKYSYKRFLFSFVPLLWFYVVSGRNISVIFEKIDDFIWSSNSKNRK